MIHNRFKQYFLISLFGMLIVWAASSFAEKAISVTVEVDGKIAKSRTIIATGFSVNGKSHGSLGKRIKKSGPADTTYRFGFRDFKHDVSCGSAVLTKDSTVTLYFSDNQCRNKVVTDSQSQLAANMKK